jgi:DNA-binding NtrC family response regulator
MTRVLIVDDDPVQLRLTSEIARRAGFSPVTAGGGDEALSLLRTDPSLRAVILDLVMPDRDGMAVMEAMAREQIAVPVIIQTAHSAMETIVSATRQGAVDFFIKPVAPERLIVTLRNVLRLGELQAIVRTERARRAGTLGLGDLASRSPAMERPLGLIQKAARTSLPILIEGEAGTGKQRAARIIHATGERASRPFVAINCAAIDHGTLDALLFGAGSEPGKLLEADTGTLYLGEIGALPAALQAKLLVVLATGELPQATGARALRVNIRLIGSASHRLLGLARSGEFNEALYNRLNVMPIYLPPLRDRTADIAPLATQFATRFAAELGKPFGAFTPGALELLAAHDWPGNILELENAVFRALVLAAASDPDTADFPQLLAIRSGRAEAAKIASAAPSLSAPVHIDAARPRPDRFQPEAATDRFVGDNGEVTPLDTVERELIAFALARYGGHMSKIARALRIGRSTLYRKLREYGLEEPVESDAA